MFWNHFSGSCCSLFQINSRYFSMDYSDKGSATLYHRKLNRSWCLPSFQWKLFHNSWFAVLAQRFWDWARLLWAVPVRRGGLVAMGADSSKNVATLDRELRFFTLKSTGASMNALPWPSILRWEFRDFCAGPGRRFRPGYWAVRPEGGTAIDLGGVKAIQTLLASDRERSMWRGSEGFRYTNTSAVLLAQIGKTPNIAKANRVADGREDELDFVAPTAALLRNHDLRGGGGLLGANHLIFFGRRRDSHSNICAWSSLCPRHFIRWAKELGRKWLRWHPHVPLSSFTLRGALFIAQLIWCQRGIF